MTENEVYITYENGIIERVEVIDESTQMVVKINLETNKINIKNGTTEITNQHYYLFKSLINSTELINNDEMTQALLKNKFYQSFLSHNTKSNDYLYNYPQVKLLFLFSHFLCPFQEVDNQMSLRQRYKSEIFNKYLEKNSLYSYNIKSLTRLVLLIPGIILLPILFIGAVIMD